MTTTLIQARIKPEHVEEVENDAQSMFAAIEAAGPDGVRYASCLLEDGTTFLVLLQLEGRSENPLAALPEFREFQQRLRDRLDGPPNANELTIVGSYRLFDATAEASRPTV